MKKHSQETGIHIKKRLIYGFLCLMLILATLMVIILINLISADRAEVNRHTTGNYARVETMLDSFQTAVEHAQRQTRTLSSAIYSAPFFATADRETLEAEFQLEGHALTDSYYMRLTRQNISHIGEGKDYCVFVRYSPASGYYLGASWDHPEGFVAPDFDSLRSMIHLTDQVTESDFLQHNSYHICTLNTDSSRVLLYTDLDVESGIVMIYGFQPTIMNSTLFSGNIGPSYSYLSTHVVLPNGEYILSSVNGEDELSASTLRQLIQSEDDVIVNGDRTYMKIREHNGGFTALYSLALVSQGVMSNSLFWPLLFCIVLFLLTSLLASYYVLRQVYQPIKALASSFPVSSQPAEEKPLDDPLQTISSTLEYYHQQLNLSRMTLEQQSNLLHRSVLLHMMLDSSYASSEEEIAYFKLNKQMSSFVLMSVEASNAKWDPENMSHTERVYHRNLALQDAENEIESHYTSYSPVCLRHERQSYILFQVSETELPLLHNAMMNTLIHLNQQQKATYVFSFSSLHTTPSDLRTAYQELLFHPDFSLSADKAPAEQEPLNMQEMLQLENRLISLIYVENYAKAYVCLSEIIRLIFQRETNVALIKNQIQSISIRTLRMLMESNAENPLRVEALFIKFEQLQEYTLSNVLDFWKNLFDELQNKTVYLGKESYSNDFDAVLQYVHQHFRDPNLSLTNIADSFHRPIASLSRSFQKYQGKGFLEVLHNLRLDAAEEEISTTNNSMKVIAEHVGYTNDITMTRAFKKYRGVTPGVYRHQGAKKAQ